jgi:hypothetical protein
VTLLGVVAWLPFGVLYLLVPQDVGRGPAGLLFLQQHAIWLAPAAVTQLMPNTMRAQASALYLFVINLIGLGLGPTIVALLTEESSGTECPISLLIAGVVARWPLCFSGRGRVLPPQPESPRGEPGSDWHRSWHVAARGNGSIGGCYSSKP